MKTIPLPNGISAIVDDDDYDRIMSFGAWNCSRSLHVWYAHKNHGGRKNRKCLMMHRVIMNAPDGLDVDHINGDGLDNRKENLRICTRSKNNASRRRCKSQTGYRGVQPENKSPNYIAQITVNRKRIWLGNFASPRLAARAYDLAAVSFFGEYATLNFPNMPLSFKGDE